jgi:hypothetical protein
MKNSYMEANNLLLDKIVCFAMSGIGGAHEASRLMITYAVRRYGFLLSTLPHDICRPYIAIACRAVSSAIFRILGVSQDVQTLDQLNCAKRKLSLPAEFGGLNVTSLELVTPSCCRGDGYKCSHKYEFFSYRWLVSHSHAIFH